MTNVKTVVKVIVYGEVKAAGTLDSAIKAGQRENKKANQNVAKLEIWDQVSDCWLADIPDILRIIR